MNIYKSIFAGLIAFVYVKFVLSMTTILVDNGKIKAINKKKNGKIIAKSVIYFISSVLILMITYFTQKKPPRLGAVFASTFLVYKMLIGIWESSNLVIKTVLLGVISFFSVVITLLLDNRISSNRILF